MPLTLLPLLNLRFRHFAVDRATTAATARLSFRFKGFIQINQRTKNDQRDDDDLNYLHNIRLNWFVHLSNRVSRIPHPVSRIPHPVYPVIQTAYQLGKPAPRLPKRLRSIQRSCR